MSIACIIPTLNEAAVAPSLVRQLIDARFSEVVVADGGSDDGTPELCRAAGARVITTLPGRGTQLAAGAAQCGSDILLFLHADSSPPADAHDLILRAMRRRGVVGGAFRLRFDAPHPLLRLYAAASRLNATPFTFGDQGLFLRREIYDAIGGFQAWPILEDLDIQRRLRRAGRFVKLAPAMSTSARRFLRDGILRRQLKNAWIVARFYAGACPFELRREYEPEHESSRPPANG